VVLAVARAFQPEHFRWRLGCLGIAALGLVLCRRLDSREAAKPRSREEKRMEGGEVCAELPVFSFQLSRIYSLWHGCHGPLTPNPSPPLSRGRGEDCVFGGQSVAGSLVHAKPRSREAAKGSVQWAFFEYEYEYRPPGRTEYEYEVWFLGGIGFCVLCVCT
jgi:hypothetical protein